MLKELGKIAVPQEIDIVSSLPKTRSGKIMRRVLKAKELGQDVGIFPRLKTKLIHWGSASSLTKAWRPVMQGQRTTRGLLWSMVTGIILVFGGVAPILGTIHPKAAGQAPAPAKKAPEKKSVKRERAGRPPPPSQISGDQVCLGRNGSQSSSLFGKHQNRIRQT